MKTIWKYDITGCAARIPVDSKILSVGFQGDMLMVWVEVDPANLMVTRHFAIYGTGQSKEEHKSETFIGTVFTNNLVFHIYDLGEQK